jgi:hypothetical protein
MTAAVVCAGHAVSDSWYVSPEEDGWAQLFALIRKLM